MTAQVKALAAASAMKMSTASDRDASCPARHRLNTPITQMPAISAEVIPYSFTATRRQLNSEAASVGREDLRAGEQHEQTSRRKERLARTEQETADRNHHLTAINPQKLYHLKNTSTLLKPEFSSRSRFSRSL